MKSKVWLFTIFYIFCYVAATSAEPVRSKRDLATIQNIIKWLLGIKEINLIQTVPIENENEKIYTIPAYQKVLVRTVPRTKKINENIGHLLAEGVYPRKTLRPVQIVQNYNPILYDDRPLVMQEYLSDRSYGHGRPLYPDVNQVPTYKEIVPSLCPMSVTQLEECVYGIHTTATESRQPLPQTPLYIQNRLREVILNRSIPTVKLQEDIVMPPPGLRKVDVSEYSLIDNRMVKNEASAPKDVIIKEERLKKIPILPIKIEPEESENKLRNNSDSSNVKKKVTFAAPVHTNYKYKMIYHNQPQRNTVVEMDSLQSQTEKSIEGTTTVPVNESKDEKKNPLPLKAMEDKVPSNYIFIPPISTDIPPPGISRVYTNMKTANSDYSAVASDNRALVAMDESPFTNVGNKNKPTRVIIRRRKLKPPPENGRGDIPENSS